MEMFVLNTCSVKKEEGTLISKGFVGAPSTPLTWSKLPQKSKHPVSLKPNFHGSKN